MNGGVDTIVRGMERRRLWFGAGNGVGGPYVVIVVFTGAAGLAEE
jgi:hypothetical protein